ncbi:hypothetical protein Aduo_012205 [Ancylostoma duodenale]
MIGNRIKKFTGTEEKTFEEFLEEDIACQSPMNSARQRATPGKHTLVTLTPGLSSTKEIEDENVSLPLWGTRKYLRSIYSVETGQVAPFDGQSIISSLANLENCTFSDGFCLLENQTIIWEPIQIRPFCRYALAGSYEAFVTLRHVVFPHPDLVSQLPETICYMTFMRSTLGYLNSHT